jgi:aminodeoxyfutalosine deaminase
MNSPSADPRRPFLRIRARAIFDPIDGFRGTSLLAQKVDNLSLGWSILALGSDQEVGHHPAAVHARELLLPSSVIVPGLVNAHTHLDLTHIGPQPHDPTDGFVAWVEMIRRARLRDDDAIARSVARGVELLLAGGTVAVGDIAGSPQGELKLAPRRALRESPLRGVSYVECFGIGRNEEKLRERLGNLLHAHADAFAPAHERVRLGLQPHAPNTVSLPNYRWVLEQSAQLGAPVCTHLAETPEEREFVARGTGPQRQLLESLGLWDDRILEHLGRGQHPVRHMEPILAVAPMLAAHCNDCPDEALEILARTGASVAYCPRASEYFGASRHFGPHRYRDMLAAGVNVCLGTDSLVNLPPHAADPLRGGISILEEMRLLARRDSIPADLLLKMGTVNGARALHLPTDLFRLAPGRDLAGLLGIPVDTVGPPDHALELAMRSDAPATLLQ